jgi:prolyl-tRNA synthetase
VSPLVLKPEVFEKVVTVIDSSLASSTDIFAVRPCTNSATVFLAGQDVHAFLQRLETDTTKLKVVDFASLSSDAPAAPITKAAAPNKKADAKIEDAHQLAIGVKKEVDFASWYTNVRVDMGNTLSSSHSA